MSEEIQLLHKTTYTPGIEMLAQQMNFALQGKVREEADTGEAVNFPQIGPVGPRQKTARHSDTQYINTPHRKRWVRPTTFEFADLLDLRDIKKIVSDPGGEYSRNMIASINRDRCRDLLASAIGTAYIGQEGTTTQAVTLTIANDSVGFTLAKVKEAMQKLKTANGVDGQEEMFIAWTAKQEKEFLDNTEVASIDYNNQRVLVSGGMDGKFFGFTYVRLEDWTDEEDTTHRIVPYTAGSPNIRSCVAWVKSGLLHNTWQAPHTKVDQLPTKNYSWQYWIGATYGSTRMQEGKVVQIDCVET